MRHWAFVLIILLSTALSGFAQDIDVPRGQKPATAAKDSIAPMDLVKPVLNVAKISPIALISGGIPGTAELQLTGEFVSGFRTSSSVSVSALFKTPLASVIDGVFQTNGEKITVSGYRFQLNYRYYFGESLIGDRRVAPYGLYVAPWLSYASAKISTKSFLQRNQYIRAAHFDMGIMLGDQLPEVIWEWFDLDVFIGFGYKRNEWFEVQSLTNVTSVDMSGLGELYNSNFKVKLGVLVGVPF